MPTTISHWMNNQVFAGSGGGSLPVTNPATGEVTGSVALAAVEDARAVIDAAVAAFPGWRDTSLAKRGAILFNFRELLNARKGELAKIITSEHGKVVSDALGEVSRGQEVVEFACGVPHLLKGSFTENASTKVDVYSIRQPLGPVGIISPFNFPAMVPMWFFPHRHRRRRHRRAQTQREGSVGLAVDGQPVGRGEAAARGVQRVAGR
jgi:malonate-semialdehyde dehydrogenase (acetylating)/methylmalonate-semialdehyde dehydrogenase